MTTDRTFNTPPPPAPSDGSAGWIKAVLLSALVLGAGAAIAAVILATQPKATRIAATKETAMLVEVTAVRQGDYAPVIRAMGTVRPADELLLSPQISGTVTALSDEFVPGGRVEAGRTLLKIDAADYKNVLRQRESALHTAEAELHQEMGRQNVARKEYALLDEPLDAENEALILRRPQLRAANAKVEAARAAAAQAELDVKRTRIKAPFEAHILERNVNIGSRVSPGDILGRLVGVERYWVEVAVPLTVLQLIDIPKGPGETGATVKVRHTTAWPKGVHRKGKLVALLGALAPDTRMAPLLVEVDDPLGYRKEAEGPPLIIGSYVEAEIETRPLYDVFRLPREALRKNDTVWIMKRDRLDIRSVRVAFRDDRFAYISDGLGDGEAVVTTHLSTVAQGARLRTASESPSRSAPHTPKRDREEVESKR